MGVNKPELLIPAPDQTPPVGVPVSKNGAALEQVDRSAPAATVGMLKTVIVIWSDPAHPANDPSTVYVIVFAPFDTDAGSNKPVEFTPDPDQVPPDGFPDS